MKATRGEFTGTLNAPNLKGVMTADSSGGWIEGCGIRVGRNYGANMGYNFYVDQNGNVWMNGSLTLKDGSIKWSNLDQSTKNTINGAYDAANDALDAAYDAYDAAYDAEKLAKRIARFTVQQFMQMNLLSCHKTTMQIGGQVDIVCTGILVIRSIKCLILDMQILVLVQKLNFGVHVAHMPIGVLIVQLFMDIVIFLEQL